MSNTIYDILGKLDGLTPKANPVSTAEPIYESVDPRGDIMSAVTQLEERFAGFKEAKTRRKEPSVETPADDLTRSSDPDVVKIATKARFAKPQAKNDFEAIVSYVNKQEKELERAEQADVVDREKIEQTQGMLAKTQANQDALRKVIDNTDQRFRALNAKVASGQVTQQDQKAAQAAQQIEKDADTAKAAVAKGATAPEQPTTAPEAPQDTSVWNNVPDTDTKADQSAKTTGAQGATDTSNTTSAAPGSITGTPQQQAANQEKFDLDAFDDESQLKVAAESMVKEAGIFDYAKNLINPAEKTQPPAKNQTPIDQQSLFPPTAASQPIEYARWNNQEFNRMKADPNLAAVELLYPKGSKVRINRATYDKLKSAFAKITDPALKKSIVVNVLSDSNQLRTYVDQIEHELPAPPQYQVGQTTTAAPGGKEYRYFYDKVGPTEVGKAFNLGLKANPQGRWYSLGQENPEATKIWGKPKALLVSPPRGKLAGTQLESLGNKNMTKPTSIIEAVRSVEDKKLKEAAKPDFLDLDKDGDTDEPMKSAAKDAKKHEPAAVDKDAVAKRKRLQALKDKQEDERAEKDDDYKSTTRFVKGRAYGGAAQKDDEDKDEVDESGLQAYLGKKKYGKEGMKALQQAGREGASKEKMAMIRAKHDKMDEVAPPGAKAERMVKGIKKSLSKDGHLSGKDKAIAYATTWKAHNKGQVEEATNFGDTIKNSKGKMTKVTVKEGKDAIRNHPIYTTKEAWDHYAQELAEQEMMERSMMEAPVVNVQQELDEIAKLAGLPVKTCEACNCAPCKCNENLAAMAPSDSASPLTHTLEEAATRKDFRQVADTIKDIEDPEKRKEHAMHYADFFKQQNSRFKREMFLAACHVDLAECGAMPAAVIVGEGDTCPTCDSAPCKCDEGMMEAEVEEGNEFSGALAAAKAAGSKEFEVGGKKYTVKEDININVSASGEEDAVNLIRKLSGMPVIAIQAQQTEEACGTCGSSPCGCEQVDEQMKDGPKERDIEYTNSPREETAGADASFPAGTDLNRPKKSYSDKPFRGDNPMAESKEDNLWSAYETMINDVKA
jgi:hypothetical protein